MIEQPFKCFKDRHLVVTTLLLGALASIIALVWISTMVRTPIRIGQGRIITFDVSPDGEHFAIGGVGGLYLYESEGCNEVWRDETEKAVIDVDFNYDGSQLIAKLANGKIIIWDLQRQKRILEIRVSKYATGDVCFSPDGTLFASGDGFGNVIIWTAAGRRLREINLPYEDVVIYDLAFSPDGTMFAAVTYWDATLIVWDTATWEQIYSYERAGVHVDWSDDSSRLGTSMNGHYNVWDTVTWEHLVHHVEEREFGNIVFLPNSQDFNVSGGGIQTDCSADGQRQYSYSYMYEHFYGCNNDYKVHEPLDGYNNRPRAIFFTSTDQFLAVHYGDRLTFWDTQTGELDHELQVPEGIRTIAVNNDGTRFATGLDTTGSVIIWDTETMEQTERYDTIYDTVDNIEISPSGEYLAAGVMSIEEAEVPIFNRMTGYAYITWELATGTIVHQSPEENTRALNFGFYLDSNELWLRNFSFEWSPDGQYLASVIDDSTRTEVWYAISLQDTSTGDILFTIPANTQRIEDIGFNPSGTILATAEPDAVYLWEVPTGNLLRKLDQCSSPLVWSHDGKQLATGSPGGLVYIWDIDL
ncbi:MAG: WD40 repeat domain-containing protein [Anaerolineae bacterium]|nr:WD40 repeat domain-containing protein [Anaerolineae bacterium]